MDQAQKRDDEGLLRRYLLGGLSIEEQHTLERHLMTDQNLFNRLLQVEEELIDEYVRGKMSDREREEFESRFVQSPRRWQDLHFGEMFYRYLTKRPRGEEDKDK